ncbi:MAG: 50S ribosomal protein L11 methyltransferase [Pseudomonadota bacterium]|nr:50S ribosomal protein L11 methyltransferase [Pseudomonadota bacterium]
MTGQETAVDCVWQVTFNLPDRAAVEVFEEALEGLVNGLSSFKNVSAPGWKVTAYAAGEPDRLNIQGRLRVAAGIANVALPDIGISPVEQRDWVAELEHTLPPIHVGPYYVFGSHVRDVPPDGAIAIQVDAGQAFGTGNHETTLGCLQAIESVCVDRGPSNPLDLGTGSGILAIAVAKRFGVRVTASDNDPIAIDVARENAGLNGVGEKVDFYVADGLDMAELIVKAPYDLIVANIVANPLIALSSDIAGALTRSGYLILSGILLGQADDVTEAYRENGLRLEDRIEAGDWVTLTLGHT